MKNPSRKSSVVSPKPHKFAIALQAQKKNSKLIRGFVGKSKSRGHVRVYLDIEMKRYVEVPAKEILHVEDPRKLHGEVASIFLWVNEKAAIKHFGNWFANEDPTTMATGEEGGGDPTTMATGEESTGPFNPIDEVVNPFGTFI